MNGNFYVYEYELLNTCVPAVLKFSRINTSKAFIGNLSLYHACQTMQWYYIENFF